MALVLDEATAAFLTSPRLSIAVASRDRDNVPRLFKAVGCRVSARRDRVTLYADQQLARDVIRALREGFPIAAVFSEALSHRTLQLKGDRADVGPVAPADREYAREHFEAVVEHIAALDYPRDAVRCYFNYSPEQLVSVAFSPDAVFEQTPGPGAGEALGR
jgi:hypothetical protein